MPKGGYHHGNLRAELIAAALALIEEKGPTGFTLSECAKRAGVTAPAVYRHFDGRAALIAACAHQGFDLFADRMEGARQAGGGGAVQRFERVGRAYLDFARTNAGHYIAMFESGISTQAAPDLHAASRRAMAVLDEAVAGLIARMPADRRPPLPMISAHIWAMSHGVVELFARPGTRAPYPPEDLLETGVGIYLRGLGLLPADA
ncbi:MAG: TetR/AcrR family transcriptional regulator [Paracoccaceae bacterium]